MAIWTSSAGVDLQILVDSSVWIDYFNGVDTPQSDLLHGLLGKAPLALGDLILAEILQGFRREKDWETARDQLLQFPVHHLGGVETALRSSRYFRFLRRRGITVRKTIDCLIATFCIDNDIALLHSDRDFKPFEEHLGLHGIL